MAGNSIRIGHSGPDSYERQTEGDRRAEQQQASLNLDKDNKGLVIDAMQSLELNFSANIEIIKRAYVNFSVLMGSERGSNLFAENIQCFFQQEYLANLDNQLKTLAVATWLHRISKENAAHSLDGYLHALQDKSSLAFLIPSDAKSELINILAKLGYTSSTQESKSRNPFTQLAFKWKE